MRLFTKCSWPDQQKIRASIRQWKLPRTSTTFQALPLPTSTLSSPDDSSPTRHRWTGTSAFSWSSSPPQSCRSCAAPAPSSDRSFFCDSLSGFPSDVRGPLCVWKKTGMSLCLCPPTRYCPSCRRFLKGPTGTGTSGSSFCCLFGKNTGETPLLFFKLACTLYIKSSTNPHI